MKTSQEIPEPQCCVEPRERASCPLPLAEAWSGLVGRAWAQCLPPCRPSPQCGPAAQGGAGTTGVWLWLVRDTRLGRVPVKVKDTYLGLELLNRSILKSKYFVWHFDSWTALKFRNPIPKRNTKNYPELGGSSILKNFHFLRMCVSAFWGTACDSWGRSWSLWNDVVCSQRRRVWLSGCVCVMETETTLRPATRTEGAVNAGVRAMLADSALERKCSRPLGWFCYLMFSY